MEYLDDASLACFVIAVLIYLFNCGFRDTPFDLVHVSKILPVAGLPTAVFLVIGAIRPQFLSAECAVSLNCLSWYVRLILAFAGINLIVLFAHGIGFIQLKHLLGTDEQET